MQVDTELVNPGGPESSAPSANVVYRNIGQNTSESVESTKTLVEQTINGIRARGEPSVI
jgi:hypothetical protein